jgi:hypothetical protein
MLTTFKSSKEVKLIENMRKQSIVKSKTILDQHIWRLYEHVEVKTEYENDDSYLESNYYANENNQRYFHRNHSNKTNGLFRSRKKQPSTFSSDTIKYPTIVFKCKAGKFFKKFLSKS